MDVQDVSTPGASFACDCRRRRCLIRPLATPRHMLSCSGSWALCIAPACWPMAADGAEMPWYLARAPRSRLVIGTLAWPPQECIASILPSHPADPRLTQRHRQTRLAWLDRSKRKSPSRDRYFTLSLSSLPGASRARPIAPSLPCRTWTHDVTAARSLDPLCAPSSRACCVKSADRLESERRRRLPRFVSHPSSPSHDTVASSGASTPQS